MGHSIPNLDKYSAFVTLPASTGKVLLATIQKAAEVVANAMLPGQELPSPHSRELKDDSYEPVLAPSSGKNSVPATKFPPIIAHKMRGIVCLHISSL